MASLCSRRASAARSCSNRSAAGSVLVSSLLKSLSTCSRCRWVWVISSDAAAADSSAVDSAEAFLRALHLQLSLGTRPPQLRSDLLLVVIDALKSSNRGMLAPTSR